jgi:hypothetical protein
MPRGGRRTGTPGTSYGSRTDLNANRGAVPIAAASGQTYGAKKAQMDAQRAMPIAPPPASAMPAALSGPPSRPVPGQMPGEVVPLDAPSQRPNEPLTAGLPVGPGAGPEVLGALASKSTDGLEDMAQWLPMLEFAASRPSATAQYRNFVRQLRGSTPVA